MFVKTQIKPQSLLDLVEELSDLLISLEIPPPYIMVGHSFEGLIVRLFASIYPKDITGVILVDAAAEFKELAYESVLPEKLLERNRKYVQNPDLNLEKIDKVRSYQQVIDHSLQMDSPLSIIIRGLLNVYEKSFKFYCSFNA
ncbi:alpha/beta fold hydrolase [Bacillus sp. NPDC077027]|uniref:alpha/beta fold hydrolase n=1 Tax=Bacillus sp. NPDC077027 TaxID=3390548 RepID=UPI003D01880D